MRPLTIAHISSDQHRRSATSSSANYELKHLFSFHAGEAREYLLRLLIFVRMKYEPRVTQNDQERSDMKQPSMPFLLPLCSVVFLHVSAKILAPAELQRSILRRGGPDCALWPVQFYLWADGQHKAADRRARRRVSFCERLFTASISTFCPFCIVTRTESSGLETSGCPGTG